MNKHGIVVQSEKGDVESRAQETFKVIVIKIGKKMLNQVEDESARK